MVEPSYVFIVISISCRNPVLYANYSVSNEVHRCELVTLISDPKETSPVVAYIMQAQPASDVLNHAFYISRFKFPVYSLFS